MRPFERWALHLSTALVTASGVAYAWMKYLLVADDPFAVVNHPWQGAMLAVHVLAAPALLVAFGVVFSSHISRKLRGVKPNRRTGLAALAAFAVMTLSGYLLQVVTTPLVSKVCLVAHLVSGGVFAAAYLAHLVIGHRTGARPRQCQMRAAA
ncbi:MAG: hypothetical protein AB1635_17225 [Acidobacteriota bacterium]